MSQSTGIVSATLEGVTPTLNSQVIGQTQPKMIAKIEHELDLNVTKDLKAWYEFHAGRGTEIELNEMFDAKTKKLSGVAIMVGGKEAFRLETATLVGSNKYMAMAKYEGIVNAYNEGKLAGTFTGGGNTSAGTGFARGRVSQPDKEKILAMYHEGKSYAEISQALNRPTGTIEDTIKEMVAAPVTAAPEAPVAEAVGLPA
jgi:hypothetical protein